MYRNCTIHRRHLLGVTISLGSEGSGNVILLGVRKSEPIQLSDLIPAVEHMPWCDATIDRPPEQAADRPPIWAEIAWARQATILLRVGLPFFIEWFQQTRDRA